jgi:hypothetical protein
MSWVEKFGKPKHESAMNISENNIPLTDVEFMRIGSAYAKAQGLDEQVLVQLLNKFVEVVNLPFDGDAHWINAWI